MSEDVAENEAHGPDWTGSLPGEPPSCRCGYNGTPEECAASRGYDDMLRWLAVQEKASELQRTHADWRRGQALFNALHSMDAELADAIRGTDADPFHNDSRECVQAFADAVMTRVTPPAPAAAPEEES